MKSKISNVLVIGSGMMALEYLKVLNSMKKSVDIVGRGDNNLNKLKNIYPDYNYYSGGIDKYLASNPELPDFAINTVNIEHLGSTSKIITDYGINNLLIEKPGDISIKKLEEISTKSRLNNSKVFVAYNRRFYASINNLVKEARKDGGITSLNFEFTEWVHTFGPDTHSIEALNHWVLSNSSHVIDTVFYLIGMPKSITTQVSGKNKIRWHPSGSIFTGIGKSKNNIPFSYHANWKGPGRWSIEVITNKRRFYLKPMEKLLEQNIGSVTLNELEIDDSLDLQFKPGLYLQTKAFLEHNYTDLLDIEDQIDSMKIYAKIAGY
tara:strand:- start:6197 stop:7159 length:963 start_codon:yes stop_codon:yes gene_type:complete